MICRFADLFAVCYLWVVCKEDKCCVVTQHVADICVTWLVYVWTYCVPIATLNQRKLTQLRPNNYNVLKPWILILFNGLSVVSMDFLFRYTRRSMGLLAFLLLGLKAGENQPVSVEPFKTIFHPFSFS